MVELSRASAAEYSDLRAIAATGRGARVSRKRRKLKLNWKHRSLNARRRSRERRRATMPPLGSIAGPPGALRLLSRPPPFEPMPDSAAKRDLARPTGDSARHSTPRRRAQAATSAGGAQGASHADAEKKLARAARSAQRLAQLSEAQRVGDPLDLFKTPSAPTFRQPSARASGILGSR